MPCSPAAVVREVAVVREATLAEDLEGEDGDRPEHQEEALEPSSSVQ